MVTMVGFVFAVFDVLELRDSELFDSELPPANAREVVRISRATIARVFSFFIFLPPKVGAKLCLKSDCKLVLLTCLHCWFRRPYFLISACSIRRFEKPSRIINGSVIRTSAAI